MFLPYMFKLNTTNIMPIAAHSCFTFLHQSEIFRYYITINKNKKIYMHFTVDLLQMS